MYTPAELAEVLKLKVTTIWAMIRRGEIKAIKIGKSYRISEEEFKRITKGE